MNIKVCVGSSCHLKGSYDVILATENFFEGMACDGGCLNGPVCITHSPRNVVDVDKYGNEAQEKTIFNSVRLYEMQH